MHLRMRNIINSLRIPLLLLTISLISGFLVGSFFIEPAISFNGSNSSKALFWNILSTNSLVILSIYVSLVFTPYYAYGAYLLNGLVLGVYIGWIVQTDLALLLLIIPHGVFEIPCILAAGVMLHKGEIFIRSNFKIYCIYIVIHMVAVMLCAVIEAYITPVIYSLV